MSVKPLDFSKHNLMVDLREVKRMFKEELSGLCQDNCVNSVWGISWGWFMT
jgi:hypothetical protein